MSKKILIVDDEPNNIFALNAVLKSKSYQTVVAENTREALQQLETHKDIQVVLLDMMMPDIDGYEAIGMIRDATGNRPLPIIAVTAQAMVGDKEKCLDAGADDYISKPIDFDKIHDLLAKLITS